MDLFLIVESEIHDCMRPGRLHGHGTDGPCLGRLNIGISRAHPLWSCSGLVLHGPDLADAA
jgi:hypothetical protein